MSAGQRSRQLALGAVVLDGHTGELRRLGPFTVHSAALDFWRAPTDNDTRNGLRTAIPDAESWRQAGLDRLQHSIITVQRGDGELRTRLRIAPAGADFGLLAALTWAADPQQRADCLLSVQVAPDGAWPCPLPKVGLRLVLDAVVQEVSWFGRGPGEAYRDTQLATRTSTSPSATGRRNCSPPPGTDRISSLTAALTSTWTLPITASAAARADPGRCPATPSSRTPWPTP